MHDKIIQKILLTFVLITLMPLVSATELHGTIYDMELNELENVLVEINTQPAQRYLAKDGKYSFQVSPGEYTLKVTYKDNWSNKTYTEQIQVLDEGSYVFDLFVFPEFTEEEELFEQTDLQIETLEKPSKKDIIVWAGVIILIILISLFLFKEIFRIKKKKKLHVEISTEPDYTGMILQALDKNEGRLTQKEIRKKIPLSEAKISLLITELEHKGLIDKIKRGRSNIIILKRIKK